MNNISLEQVYQNATFDYLDYEEDTYRDFEEAIEVTEDFLVDLDYNFYDYK